jgi:pSer/pThr/pTyr-binding forkhead associated (FHA) protein
MAKNLKLTVLFEKLRGQSFEIDRETMSVGRRETADIRLADGSVSGHHADIIRSYQDGEDCYILRDNDSTNGTRINNEPVTERILKDSDLITFGNVEVLFDSGDSRDNGSQFTHTIDLGNTELNTATTQTLVNFNPLAETEKKKNAVVGKLVIGVATLLGLAALYLAVKVLFD